MMNATDFDTLTANTTNVSIAHDLTPFQIFVTSLFIALTSVSLLAYAIVLLTLFLYFQEFNSNIYCFVASLAVADIAYLGEVLFYCVSCNILQRDIAVSSPYLTSVIAQITYYTICTHLAYIGITRVAYAASCGPDSSCLDKIFLSKSAVVVWIVALWAGSTIVPIIEEIAGCDLTYNVEQMSFGYVCANSISEKFSAQVLMIDTVVSGILPSLITACHMTAWFIIYWRGKKSGGDNDAIAQKKKRERRLLLQFTLISLFLFLYYISFWTVPLWFGEESVGIVVITINAVLASAVNPFTYLTFNKIMKRKVKYLLCDVLLGKNKGVPDADPIRNARLERAPGSSGAKRMYM